ncbi:hypothetical protein M407DRAFT_68051 [Tulasnella calospora MUT 4182]|uniref:Conserved oligomeric Golgi complex subunit 2 n=1 Tax=Tulasnella calospora MUT 4182 TaxID=1051891 RepID=A0A0C3QT58_9AGAM|nr:hypothetical protein M407DRAFT_68051 [Tulasnella calospora MUT 4182]
MQSPRTSSSRVDASIELPQLIPLSHAHPALSSSEPFDVDAFLLSRSGQSLQDLRSELRGYLANLKEELVQLINDDYAAFISLSTDLKGEGVRLERLAAPLPSLRAEIVNSRNDLRGVQDAVQDKLTERAELRQEKALLQMLLKLSDSVVRLESLLLIASADQNTSQTSVDFSALGIRGMNGLALNIGEDDLKDDRSRGGQAKHLARIATEYTQLLYHAEKAKEEKCAFVEEVQWRVTRIKTTLSRDLDHLFSDTLVSLTSSTIETASVTDKARWTSDLTECLKTYDLLRNWRDAEEAVRRDLVQPFVKSTIFADALNVTPSPILVRTALPGRASLMSPRTPYTPFTGVRANPFDAISVGALPLLPEEDDEPLANLYNTILRFIQVNCTGVLELSEKINAKNRKTGRRLNPAAQTTESPQLASASGSIADLGLNMQGFEIMANVIWAEIGRSIMEELGSVVFSAGNPSEFQKNYTITNNFITSLEHLAPSIHAVETMREHPIYNSFQRRWQLPVYFQLRWKEIVGGLEDNIANPSFQKGEAIPEDFATSQAAAFYSAIQACWSSGVFIPELAHRFWRLTLQLLSRYKSWLDSNMPPREQPLPSNSVDISASGSGFASRTATPIATNEPADTSAVDEATLQRLVNAYLDISAMKRRVWDLWKAEIGMLLPEDTRNEAQKPEEVLKSSLEHLHNFMPEISSQIMIVLSRRCCTVLSRIKSIISQFWAMNKKRDPTGPSDFVPDILKPIRQFFELDGVNELIDERDRQSWANQIFEFTADRYTAHLGAMKQTKDSLKRYKKGFSLFGGGGSRDGEEAKDEERLRAQILLDVEAFGEDARRLGVAVDASEAYAKLRAAASSYTA